MGFEQRFDSLAQDRIAAAGLIEVRGPLDRRQVGRCQEDRFDIGGLGHGQHLGGESTR